MTVHYLGVLRVAEELGVTRHAVHKWRSRYPAGGEHAFPEPDVEIDGIPGWRPERVAELRRWREGLPGRGAGGGRPSASQQEYLQEAGAHGLSTNEALRLIDALIEQSPQMTRAGACAWMLGHWRA
ncbi:hypothetical protein [Cryptosporangium sp. NPDC051539]|uniref:hypothetical protein n=1 Tax=Cryptosporangium sp. NPDC051539 TaxID=3363962 RepID=UPI0037A26021